MVTLNNLHDLFIDQLRDLYNAESQLIKALPKMAKAATDPQLKQAFETHLQQTEEHVRRLEQLFEKLGVRAKGKTCYAMKGLIDEGKEQMSEEAPPEVMDAGLIAAAQRVEHYEIAGYGTVRTFARFLGDSEAENILQQTLDEEGEADKKLTSLAESNINTQAEQGQ